MYRIFIIYIIFPIIGFSQIKKGIGLTESKGFDINQLEMLKVQWFYNWGLTTKINSHCQFIPMCFSLRSIPKLSPTEIILGFNEPDNKKQSHSMVANAIENWTFLEKNALKLGSPAIAGNCLTQNNWLDLFLESNPKVDFICLHWYKGCNADKFIADLKKVIQKYKKPIWVTEFAPQTTGQSKVFPEKFSEKEVAEFIKKTVSWMENEPMIEKYAWHDSKIGSCSLFTNEGNLTYIGLVYSQAK